MSWWLTRPRKCKHQNGSNCSNVGQPREVLSTSSLGQSPEGTFISSKTRARTPPHSSYLRLESLEERRDISRHRLHHAEKPYEKYQMAACPEFPSSTLMASMGPRPSQRSDSKRVLKQKRTRTDNFYEGVHRRGVTICAHSGLRRVLCWETEAQPAFF